MEIPGRRTSNEQNRDGSVTTKTTTIHWDGSKTVKRRTARSKTPDPSSRSSATNSNNNQRNARSRSPTRTRSGSSTTTPVPLFGNMSEILEDMMGFGHYDNAAFEQKVKHCIPSEFVLLASQDDYTQAQEDWFAMDHYKLDVSRNAKKINAGSVATCALLQLMQENPKRLIAGASNSRPLNCLQVIQQIKKRVKEHSKLEAKPTMSSSRPLGPPRLTATNANNNQPYAPFYIVPPGYTGKRRALLIGVKVGEGPDLKGSHNDIDNLHQFLRLHCGFKDADTTVLRDDGRHVDPTRKNILAEFAKLCRLSKPKDIVFIQFSGHGGRVKNNLYICPSDYKKGPIMDEVILRDLIKAMPANVYTTMLVDCCYSGTVGDLPYVLKSPLNGARQEIETYFDVDTRQEMIRWEREGGQKYQNFKQARAERRSMWRLMDGPAKMVYDAATGVYTAVGTVGTDVYRAAETVGTGVYQAAETVGTDVYRAAETVGTGVYQGAGNVATGMYQAAETVGTGVYRTAGDVTGGVYTAAETVGTGVYRTAGDVTGGVYQAAGAATDTLRKSTNEVYLAAGDTFRKSGTAFSDSVNMATQPLRRTLSWDNCPGAQARPEAAAARNAKPAPNKAFSANPRRDSGGLKARGKGPVRRTQTVDNSLPTKREKPREKAPLRRVLSSGDGDPRTTKRDSGTNVFSAFYDAANTVTAAATAATTAAANAANAAGTTATATFRGSNLRRPEMAPVPAPSPTKRKIETTPAPARGRGRAKSTPRRTETAPARVQTKASAARSQSPAPMRQRKSAVEVAEEKARKEAVARSRREAEEARAQAATSRQRKSAVEAAEEKARKEAVARSRREAEEARAQGAPSRQRKSAVEAAEEKARDEAVARSRREAEEARAQAAPSRQRKSAVEDAEERARKEAVARSRREAEQARAQAAPSRQRKSAVEDAEEKARKEAVARSRREAEEARAHAAPSRQRKSAVEDAEELARKEAVARSKREAEEEKARKEAVARSKREAEEARAAARQR